MGDLEAGNDEIDAYVQLAKELRQPHYLGWATLYEGTRAFIEGRFDRTERFNQEASPFVERAQQLMLTQAHGWQAFWVRRETLGWQGIEAELKAEAEDNPYTLLPLELACLYADTDRHEAARAELDASIFNDLANRPEDGIWLFTAADLSRLSALLGDARRSSILYDLLLPYADRNVVLQGFHDYMGSASRYLGLLAATMKRWDDAERHFEDALEMNSRMGARPWVAHTRHDYADMLLTRDELGDREKALELVSKALDAAQEMGMKPLVEKALALKLRAQGIDTSDVQSSIDAVALAVQTEHPDLSPQAAPDGTVTILFSDIEGSTEMTERLGDRRWLEVLHEHNAIIRRQVAECGGFEVKAEGDGFMLAFGSARTALGCAIEMQRALAERNDGAEEPIKVRIGLHTGEAIKEGEDFFGKHVILAARIAGKASGGDILVSSLLKELTESAGDVEFGEGREVELKGLAGSHRVFEVVW